jgi:hypothetical protein
MADYHATLQMLQENALPFKALQQIDMELHVLQRRKPFMTKKEVHRRSLDIHFDICTYVNRQVKFFLQAMCLDVCWS